MKRCEVCNKVVPEDELSYEKRCPSCAKKLEEQREDEKQRKKYFPSVLEQPYNL